MIDDEPKPKMPDVVLGAPLDALSVAELEARIARLRQEISRIESAIESKKLSRNAADSFFRTSGER